MPAKEKMTGKAALVEVLEANTNRPMKTKGASPTVAPVETGARSRTESGARPTRGIPPEYPNGPRNSVRDRRSRAHRAPS